MLLLQNECGDDDLEHFEDTVEDPESAIPPSNNLMSQGGSAASENDEYLSKEDSKSVVAVDLDNESRSKAANGVTEKAEKSHVELALPGSYNPQHREPSY